MNLRRIATTSLTSLLALAVLGTDRPARAGSETFEIHVNSAAAGLSTGPGGAIDLTLNADNTPPASVVSASVFNMTTDGTVGAVSFSAGDVTGKLPNPVSMDNKAANNELTQDFTVKSFFDVFVTLTGPEIGGGGAPPFSGTTFSLSIYDSNLNHAPAIGQLLVLSDGSVRGLPSAGVTIAPEPSSTVLMGLGLGVILAAGRRRKRRSAA